MNWIEKAAEEIDELNGSGADTHEINIGVEEIVAIILSHAPVIDAEKLAELEKEKNNPYFRFNTDGSVEKMNCSGCAELLAALKNIELDAHSGVTYGKMEKALIEIAKSANQAHNKHKGE